MKKLVVTKIKMRKNYGPCNSLELLDYLAEFEGWKELEMGSVVVFVGEDLPVYKIHRQRYTSPLIIFAPML